MYEKASFGMTEEPGIPCAWEPMRWDDIVPISFEVKCVHTTKLQEETSL